MGKRSPTKKPELAGSRVKISFKRHILPPLFGILAMVVVLGFLNSQVIAARIFLSTYEARPLGEVNVKQNVRQSQLVISKLGIDVPVIYGRIEANEYSFQLALRDGVVHYPGTAVPGQTGNVVIFGHSSGQVWAPGNYKFVFATLDKLDQEDRIHLEYKGIRYIYAVSSKKVVPPTEVSVLNQTSDNTLTLITCTPVGTNKNRLIITAKQMAPKTTSATGQESKPVPLTELEGLPSNHDPSVWESIRSIF